jgi:hypothetical protein
MNVPSAPSAYDPKNEASFREIVKRAVDKCFSRGQDVEIGQGRLILTDTATGHRYGVTVVSGVVTLVLVS